MDKHIKNFLKPKFPVLQAVIVDDQEVNLNSLTLLLTSMGFKRKNIRIAKNGGTALMMINKLIPDLVLTDWNMPMGDGLELVKSIREKNAYGNISTILVTAEEDKDIETARPFVNAVLKKPYSPEELETQIYKAMAHRALDEL
ncbi:MAG: response regulator [Nitrospinae bacterium]|nr:response regulator [Nitrospinota bacterium]